MASMDFFRQQDLARRRTFILVFSFILVVAVLVLSVELLVLGLIKLFARDTTWNTNLILFWTAYATFGVIITGTIFKMLALREGGKSIVRLLNAQEVFPESKNPNDRKLLNIVEEMSIASGIPVPPVYVMREQPSINAFVAGHDTRDAVIIVTEGAIRLLSREELQGVVAHEFSHIFNGDMLLNLRIAGVLHGVLMFYLAGHALLDQYERWEEQSPENNWDAWGNNSQNPESIMFFPAVFLIAVGSPGAFFGNIVKSLLSQEREFLADASAIQFTRNPSGLAGALKKIGGLKYGSEVRGRSIAAIEHFFFATGTHSLDNSSFSSWFSTHPPLETRIHQIDPSFDGQYPKVESAEMGSADYHETIQKEVLTQLSEVVEQPIVRGIESPLNEFQTDEVLASIGAPTANHLVYASNLIDRLPPALLDRARETYGARAIVYGLLFSKDQSRIEEQAANLRASLDPEVVNELWRIASVVRNLAPQTRLPLLDIALPALRKLSHSQYRLFRKNILSFSDAFFQYDLFSYILKQTILHHLDPLFGEQQGHRKRYRGFEEIKGYCQTLLLALAWRGSAMEKNVQEALDSATACLDPSWKLLGTETNGLTLSKLDTALGELSCAAPKLKRKIVKACLSCVAADDFVNVEEAELLRAISLSLDCPLPPFVGESADSN